MGSKAATRLLLPLLLPLSPRLPPRIISSRKLVSTKASPNLEPPDVARLAQTARISLTPQEVEEVGPKIRQVIDWFGQLQNVDLDGVEPAVGADIEGGHARQDIPETFDSKDAIITAIPSYEEPYVKVPTVLNKE